MDLTGSEFKELEVSEQVQLVNDLIEHGYSVERIRKSLDIGKNYIANTFKKYGYVKDKKTKLFIKTTEATVTTKNTTKATSGTNKANKDLQKPHKDHSKPKTLEGKVEALEDEIKSIRDTLGLVADSIIEFDKRINELANTTNATNTTNTTNTTTTSSKLNVKKLKGNKVTRSFKLNEQVQKDFKAFCKANSEYEVGEILATAVLEYMEKYK